MTIRETLKEKNMSVYRLAKESRIPYATVNDICSGKASLEKCSGETIYKLAKALELSMEELLTPYLMERNSFENFKSTVCHRLKELGDLNFIMDTLESGDIRMYYEKKWYPESLYLLAMLDYISRENHIALDCEFDDIRQCKLEKALYPLSLQAMSLAVGKQDMQKEAEKSAIPEFLRFNIIESDVRNVI
ncbi:helix-turn-helix transcriptional regulator [Oribacterium sinus]|uniref:helix-turn-helix transcriptional regulator n=1 Tax=Oribacterium sinus TaxID=237576 RepID=UPI0028E8C910|nr:helix-turn-helix transcriptional regulator [Oribacterium sinus]